MRYMRRSIALTMLDLDVNETKSTREVEVEVPAGAPSTAAVHRMDGRPDSRLWGVTHVGSGLAVADFLPSKAAARRLAEALLTEYPAGALAWTTAEAARETGLSRRARELRRSLALD